MADFQLKVTAETQRAERDLQRLDKTANEATKERSIQIQAPNIGSAAKSFSDLGKNLNNAANDIKKFYGVAKQLPGIGDSIKRYEGALQGTAKATSTLANNTKAGEILSHSFEKAGSAVGTLVNNLAKVGFALFGIKEAVGILQAAFGGFFNQTIGREIKLRETILKTQTTLASTNKVFKNGQEITDPYQKIVALTGAVAKHIDSIRERSIALAGVTSNEVIEVFGIVASQVGQIGGGLKEAEDLAINFAAALGTFGIPLYQARQEIGSILRGDITTDSYLAKALVITNEDIAKAKSQAGGVAKFLEERLAAAVAGQRIAAQGFSGVISNIKDLYELIGQRFGAKLLDPLLNALASVFENLFRVKEQLFAIADTAGSAFARVAAIGKEIRSRSGLVSLGEIGLEDDSGKKAINNIQDAVQDVVVLVEGAAQRSIGAIAQAIKALKPSVMTVADAFIRLGRVFIEIKVDTFESLARVIANLISAATPLLAVFTTLFNLYSRLLDLPVVKELAKLATTMSVLKRAGMDFITNLILVGNTIISVVVPAVGKLGVAFGVVIGGVGALVVAIGKLTLTLGGLAAALAGVPGIAAGVARALFDVSRNLNTTGQSSLQTGNNLGVVAGGFKNLGETAKLAGLNIVKSLGWTLLIQAAVTVLINAFGEYQKAQEEATRTERAALALERLGTVYRNVGDDADYATKAARDFERALADAEYTRVIERLETIGKKLNDLEYEAQRGIQTWGELWRILGRIANFQADPFGSLDNKEASRLLGEEARLREYARKYEAEQNKNRIKENIDLEAQNRANLEKEIGDLKRQIDNDIFQQRQTLAQKEVEIFRAEGELRIFQMEQANAKMIEGEEGASAAALEALNTYLSTRERGELDIEAAKKSLAIEAANLERQIADYRLDMEKKIFELRKRAGENDIKSAQLRRQQLEAAAKIVPGGAVRGGAVVTNRNDPDGEQTGSDIALKGGVGAAIQNPFSSLRITKVGQQGSGSGSTGKGFGNYVTGEAVLNGKKFEVLLGHLNETVVRVGDVLESGAVIGTQGITGRATGPHVSTHVNALNGGNAASVLSAIENAWVKGGTIQSRSLNQAPKVEALQSAQDIPDQSAVADRYAEAVRGLASALERARALQEAITNARTAAAFEAIAKAAFPKVNLEQYQDRLIELGYTYDALANSSADAFNPERSAIEVTRLTQAATANRELQQILKGIADQTKLSEAERAKAVDDLNKKHADYLKRIQEEAVLKQRIVSAEQANNIINQLRVQTQSTYDEIEALKLRNRLAYEGVSPELINAELAKLDINRQVTRLTDDLNKQLTAQIELRARLQQQIAGASAKDKEELQKKLDEALAEIDRLRKQIGGVGAAGSAAASAIDAKAKAETEPGQKIKGFIAQATAELKDLEALAVRVSQSIGNAIGSSLSNGISGLIEGTTTAKQVFADFLKQVGQILVQEGTKMIGMYIAIGIAKIFAGLSSGASSSTSATGPNPGGIPSTGNVTAPSVNGFDTGSIANVAANGAYFSNGVATFAKGGVVSSPTLFKFADGGAMRTGLMGEAGPEAIMPLSRSANGRLGVEASGLREAMNASPGGNNKVPTLNMSFETTNIAGVEYVSREQLEQAMAATRRQAANDGAKRGMSMTLDRIQQSPQTRNRLGIR